MCKADKKGANVRREEEEEHGRKAGVAGPSDPGAFGRQSVVKERDGDLRHPASDVTPSPATSASSHENEDISEGLKVAPCFLLLFTFS